jgi:hypothetical protein
VPITINIVSSNPAHVEVYSIQHYVIKFVSDLRHIGGFLRFRFPPPIKGFIRPIVCASTLTWFIRQIDDWLFLNYIIYWNEGQAASLSLTKQIMATLFKPVDYWLAPKDYLLSNLLTTSVHDDEGCYYININLTYNFVDFLF